MVVLVFPAGELLGQLLGTLELRPPIELVGVGSMTALDLAVALRASSWDSAVQNADILEVPGEVGNRTRTRGRSESAGSPSVGAVAPRR